MARLALRLQVFISSPSDVEHERNEVERVILGLGQQVQRDDLLVTVYRFEKEAQPGYGRPVDQGLADLRKSELVIAILGKGLGSPSRPGSEETGTLEEIRIAEELVRAGKIDDLFLYYRSFKDGTPARSIASTIGPIMESRKQTVWPYAGPADLAGLVKTHVERWLENWRDVPEICRHAFEHSNLSAECGAMLGENRLDLLLKAFDLTRWPLMSSQLGAFAVQVYQQDGVNAANRLVPAELADQAPFIRNMPGDGARFAHRELFFLACAYGLLDAILAGDTSAVAREPYVNEVHQYLAAMVARSPDPRRIERELCTWLQRRHGVDAVRATGRNFAAYVLGMIGAHDAAGQLAKSLVEDNGQDVRLYCIASLGKLRSRRHLTLLRDIYKSSRQPEEQEMIAKAICRIVDVANFEL